MRFWDTSAILPLISQEPLSEEMRRLLEEDAGMVVWWATRVECVSAISRRVREGSFDPGQEASARGLLDDLSESWTEVRPASRLRVLAEQTLTTHPPTAGRRRPPARLRPDLVRIPTPGTPLHHPRRTLEKAASRLGFDVLPNQA